MVQGECVISGAPPICPDCGQDVLEDIRSRLRSDDVLAFITTNCLCGPYSRESLYIEKRLGDRIEREAIVAIKAAGSDPDARVEALKVVLESHGAGRS